jgi:hypothetical protein
VGEAAGRARRVTGRHTGDAPRHWALVPSAATIPREPGARAVPNGVAATPLNHQPQTVPKSADEVLPEPTIPPAGSDGHDPRSAENQLIG